MTATTSQAAADAEIDARLGRLRELDDAGRWSLLCFLDGYAPEGVDKWFERPGRG